MPASRTAIRRSLSPRRIDASAVRVTAGSIPRKASLAPSSTMTASLPSGTDQASRANPSDAVSPETPALVIATATPLAWSARASCSGKLACTGSPNPAVSESPSATIWTGGAGPPRALPIHGMSAASVQAIVKVSATAAVWTGRPRFPYRWIGTSVGPSGRREAFMQPLMDATLTEQASQITLSGVNLSLGRGAAQVHILKDIGLNIGPGEAVGLVGPSGSGKSTLLMVMAGLERPDTGTVMVSGHDLGRLDEDALARFRGRHIGIVFQSFHLIPTMTAMENVAVGLELGGC